MEVEKAERAERLREAMGSEWTASALARRLDVAPSTFSSYTSKGVIPPFDVGDGICEILGIRPRWYLHGEGDKFAKENGGRDSVETIDGSVASIREFAGESGDVFHFMNRGEAMAPTIPNGAKVVLSRVVEASEIEDGCVYLIRVGETVALRRLQKMVSGGFVTVCDNKSFAIEQAPPELKPVGKALRVEVEI